MSPPPRFTELYLLGAGGMGEVQLARMERGTDSFLVALKRIRAAQSTDPGYLQNFEREARLGSRVHHPNVVGLKDYGTDEKGPYLALEYVHGQTAAAILRQLKKQGRPLTVEAALAIALGCARGLTYLHEEMMDRPVIHRDVSPDNVLLAYDGSVRLADLGIARPVGDSHHTRTGAVKGKLQYFAPELFESKRADQKSDVFALGVSLFELTTGVRPFSGNSDAELMFAILSAKAPPVGQLRPDLPRPLCDWMDAALQRDPTLRPTASALVQICQSLSTPSGSPTLAISQLVDVLFPQGADPVRSEIVRTFKDVRRATHTVPVNTSPWKRDVWRKALAISALLCTGAALGAGVFALGRKTETPPSPPAPAVLSPGPLPAGPLPAPPELKSERGLAEHRSLDLPPLNLAVRSLRLKPKNPSPEVRRAPAAQPPLRTPANGLLHIRAYPWAHVFLDGTDQGITPLPPLSVAPGEHVVILVNEKLGIREHRRVNILSGETSELKVLLEK